MEVTEAMEAMKDEPGPSHVRAALAYIGQSLAVVRVRPRNRAALTSWDDATTDPAVATTWWTETPEAGVGIRIPPGRLVVDIDPRHGGHPDQLAPLPRTATVRTGRGGWHLWFQHPDVKLRYQVDSFGPAINVLLPGRPIYLPPTIHPCGDRYRWEDTAPPALLPAHVIEQFRDRTTRRTSTPADTRHLHHIQRKVLPMQVARARCLGPGDRNKGLFNCGFVLGKLGIDEHTALDTLLAVAPIDHDFIEREARAAIRSGWRRGHQHLLHPRDRREMKWN